MLGLGQRALSVRYWATRGLDEKVRSEQNMKVGNVAKCLSWEAASGLVCLSIGGTAARPDAWT